VTDPPTTADALRKNPLGIYVDAIDWSRELEPPAPPSPPPPSPAAAEPAPAVPAPETSAIPEIQP